jgi:AcrR family transcriptional regulator
MSDLDPRVVRTRAAVLAATCDALVEEGYAGVTIDGICRRCGVARTTVYRHWGSLPELVFDAVRSVKPPFEAPDTGSVRDDVLALLWQLRDALQQSRWGELLPVLVDASFREGEVFERHCAVAREGRNRMRQVLDRGVDRGELVADIDLDLLVERLGAPLFYRHLIGREPVEDAYLSRLVDSTLAGLIGQPHASAGSWG